MIPKDVLHSEWGVNDGVVCGGCQLGLANLESQLEFALQQTSDEGPPLGG